MKLNFSKTKGVLELSPSYAVFIERKGKEIRFRKIDYGKLIEPNPFKSNLLDEASLAEKISFLRGKSLTVLLPDGVAVITYIELPELPEDEEEERELVNFYVRKRYPFIDRLKVAYQTMSPKDKRVLVGVMSEEVLNSYLRFFADLEVKPVSIQISSISALNFLLSAEAQHEREFLYLDASPDRVVLLYVKDGKLEVYRLVRDFTEEGRIETELESIFKFVKSREIPVFLRKPQEYSLNLPQINQIEIGENWTLVPGLGAIQ